MDPSGTTALRLVGLLLLGLLASEAQDQGVPFCASCRETLEGFGSVTSLSEYTSTATGAATSPTLPLSSGGTLFPQSQWTLAVFVKAAQKPAANEALLQELGYFDALGTGVCHTAANAQPSFLDVKMDGGDATLCEERARNTPGTVDYAFDAALTKTDSSGGATSATNVCGLGAADATCPVCRLYFATASECTAFEAIDHSRNAGAALCGCTTCDATDSPCDGGACAWSATNIAVLGAIQSLLAKIIPASGAARSVHGQSSRTVAGKGGEEALTLVWRLYFG